MRVAIGIDDFGDPVEKRLDRERSDRMLTQPFRGTGDACALRHQEAAQ